MRNDQEFLAEIYSREAKYIKCKKKITQGVLLSIIPLFICASIVAAVSIMPLMTKSAPSANKSPATEKYETLTDNEGIIDDVADEGVAEDVVSEVVSSEQATGTSTQGNQTSDLKTESNYSTKHDVTNTESVTDNSTNDSFLKTPEWLKKHQKKWKPVVDAVGYTVVYNAKTTFVDDESIVDGMETIITDPYHKIVDNTDNSHEILTIEMGGMKFVLKSKILYNATLDESYLLNELFIKALKNNLDRANLLTDELTVELDSIINSMDIINSDEAQS